MVEKPGVNSEWLWWEIGTIHDDNNKISVL